LAPFLRLPSSVERLVHRVDDVAEGPARAQRLQARVVRLTSDVADASEVLVLAEDEQRVQSLTLQKPTRQFRRRSRSAGENVGTAMSLMVLSFPFLGARCGRCRGW
jgi:hypothetical protein